MDIDIIFQIIGQLFFNEPVYWVTFILLLTLGVGYGLKNPVIAVGLYYVVSIVYPQSFLPALQNMPLAKIMASFALFSLLINSSQIRFFFPKNFWLLILFLICSYISYFNAVNPHLAEKRFWEFNKITIMAFLTVWSIISIKKYRAFFFAILGSFYFIILKSLVETQTRGKWYAIGGTSGWIGDSNDWSLALAMIIPLIYIAIITSKNQKWQLFNLGRMLSALFVQTITSSRGGFLATVGGLGILLATEKNKKIAIISTLIGAIILVHYIPPSYYDQIKSIFTAKEKAEKIIQSEDYKAIEDDKYTGAERVWNWKIAFMMMKDYPWTGVGWGNYVYMRGQYESTPGDTVCHSTWFQIGSEAGIVALLTFLGIIIVSLYNLLKIYRQTYRLNLNFFQHHARGLMGGFIAYLIGGTFVSREYSDLFYAYVCMTVILNELMIKEIHAYQKK